MRGAKRPVGDIVLLFESHLNLPVGLSDNAVCAFVIYRLEKKTSFNIISKPLALQWRKSKILTRADLTNTEVSLKFGDRPRTASFVRASGVSI